jgi:hypothetical protein
MGSAISPLSRLCFAPGLIGLIGLASFAPMVTQAQPTLHDQPVTTASDRLKRVPGNSSSEADDLATAIVLRNRVAQKGVAPEL